MASETLVDHLQGTGILTFNQFVLVRMLHVSDEFSNEDVGITISTLKV